MSNVKTGGMAFPSGEQWRDAAGNLNSKGALHCGMTLRDYFAAHADAAEIQHMLGKIPKVKKIHQDDNGTYYSNMEIPDNAYQIAKYMCADAMLAARESNQ